MIHMLILFFVADIETSKSKNLIFHVIFFNKDISVTTLDITIRFFYDSSSYPFRGKRVSDFSFRP